MNSIQFIDEVWPRRARHTTDPIRALWRDLGRFGGRDAADRLFRTARGDSANVERFCNSITMADSYFVAYEEADETIDALLLYYGSMYLARAVVYAGLTFAEIEGWEPKHGIQPEVDLNQRLIFLDTRLAVGGARQTFSLVNQAFGGDPLSSKTFAVHEIMACIPSMESFLREPFGIEPRIIEFAWKGSLYSYDAVVPKTSQKCGGGARFAPDASGSMDLFGDDVDLHITVDGRVVGLASHNEAYLRDHIVVYPNLSARQVEIRNAGMMSWRLNRLPSAMTLDAANVEIGNELSALLVDANGRRYFLPKLKKHSVPEFSLYYAVVFALSTLCRYYPDEWLRIQHGQTDEHMLMREFLHDAEHKLPLLALNHLSKRNFEFVTI